MIYKVLINVQDIIEKYNINLVEGMFMFLTFFTCVSGALTIFRGPLAPIYCKYLILYGKLKYNKVENKFLSRLEVPKSLFCHFYIFAFGWSLCGFYLMLKGLIMQKEAPEFVLNFLDFMGGGRGNRIVLVRSSNAILAIALMTLQCTRRCYETNCVQIFSKKSKVNVFGYLLGYLHYFGVILSLLINTEGFVRDSKPGSLSFNTLTIWQYISTCLFIVAWWQQWKANIMLVNLRRDSKSGKVNTEQHYLPNGGFFNIVSSPHMLFEVIMYTCILAIIPESNCYQFVFLFVLANQTTIALLTHKWYKRNFENYPKQRKALIPFLL